MEMGDWKWEMEMEDMNGPAPDQELKIIARRQALGPGPWARPMGPWAHGPIFLIK